MFIFCFWLEKKKAHKKVINAKPRKVEHSFVDKVFNFDFTKFQKDWRNIMVAGVHRKLYSQSSVKFPVKKHTSLLPLNYSHCFFIHCNRLIQDTCLTSCISLFNRGLAYIVWFRLKKIIQQKACVSTLCTATSIGYFLLILKMTGYHEFYLFFKLSKHVFPLKVV